MRFLHSALAVLKAHVAGTLLTTLLWVGIPLTQSIRAGEDLAVSLDVAAPLFVMVCLMVFGAAIPAMAATYPLIRRMGYRGWSDWVLAGAVFGLATGLVLGGAVVHADAPATTLAEHYLRCVMAGLAFGLAYWAWLVRPTAA